MRRLKLLIIITFVMSIIIGCTENENNKKIDIEATKQEEFVNVNQELSIKEKLEDFEYMYKIISENHPYLEVNKRVSGIDWLANKEKYIEKIKFTKDDNEYFKVMAESLQEIKNGHTNFLNRNYYHRSLLMYESNAKANSIWLKQLNNPKTRERYYDVKLYKKYSLQKTNHNKNKSENNVTTKIIEKSKIAYLGIKTFTYHNVYKDKTEVQKFLKSIKDYQALIIDIRGNGGGDTRYWTKNIVPLLINRPTECTGYIAYRGGNFGEQFIKQKLGLSYNELNKISDFTNEKLPKAPKELFNDFKYYYGLTIRIEPKNSVGFNGKIYLLIDSNVFSSSDFFAVFAKSTGFATLIGQKTGGDGIGTDPILCSLPNSGYIFRFPNGMGLTQDGTCNAEEKTSPHIEVDSKKTNDIKYDKAIQTVIRLETE
ncbi:S41 family peptidase [Clostridiaceae bacterium M8S5]|nr:S41 family peptidase [Clostridiaceae bacterium M8S5]